MKKRQWGFVRIIIINVGVFLSVALALNLLASLYLDGRSLWKKIFVPINEKAYTESLPDQDYAYLIYREKNNSKLNISPMLPGVESRFPEKPSRSTVKGTARII